MERSPVGGKRQPVYDFLKDHGFLMSRNSDKCYLRADGVELHLYGAGSMARIYDKDRNLLVDDKLEAAVIQVKLHRTSLPDTGCRSASP
jgi:hypothetical protein